MRGESDGCGNEVDGVSCGQSRPDLMQLSLASLFCGDSTTRQYNEYVFKATVLKCSVNLI